MELLGDGLLLRFGEVGAEGQRMRIGARGILLDLLEEGIESGRLIGQLLVVPGGGGVGGKSKDIWQVHAWVCGGFVDVGGEVEDLREQDDAIQVDALVVLKDVGEDGGACGAVALAKKKLGRVPAVVLGDEPNDEACEGVGVFVDAPEGRPGVFAEETAEACAGHIDKDQIAGVEQRFRVVGEFVGRGGEMLVALGDYMLGSERAHVKPDGGSAGSAVVKERDGAVLGLRVFLEVGDVRHSRGWRCIFGFIGFVESELSAWEGLSVKSELCVVVVGGGHGEDSDDGGVGDVLAGNVNGALSG